MAIASTRVRGYQCEFLEAVPEDFRCGVCSHVAREAQLVSCCTEVFCKACITAVSEDKKPCPLCEAADYDVFPSVKAQKKILAFDVRCTMKDRGCEWTGKLEGLETHLDVSTGDCEYISIECPNKCGQHSLKDSLSSHLASNCSKREFTCQYCNFKATYDVVCDDHLSQCSFYPVPCPNACGIQAIERGDLEAHLLQCPLEEVECEFSYAGCSVKLSYEELQEHMKENVQHHLVLMSKTFRKCQEQLQKQTLENKAAIQDLQKHMQICSIYCPTLRVPYYAHRKKAGGWWHSPPLYTRPGGYKFRIAVHVQGYKGAYGTHITASMDALKGSSTASSSGQPRPSLPYSSSTRSGTRGISP